MLVPIHTTQKRRFRRRIRLRFWIGIGVSEIILTGFPFAPRFQAFHTACITSLQIWIMFSTEK